MQILLTIKNTGIIDIPVNYNYIIQSAIFHLIADVDEQYAKNLHNVAFGEKTKYKLFTFGELKGRIHFHEKKLYLEGDLRLEIRSVSADFIRVFSDISEKNAIFQLGKHQLCIKEIDIADFQINEPLITVRTISPIVAKIQTEDHKSIYFSPEDVRFIKRLREAFENKYAVVYGKKPDSTIDILPIYPHKKVVTNYKGTWITAYHGKFQLYGEPEYLQLLYDTGLGVKTSQGFGMVEIVK